MIDTKIILVEGLPGSGKSTTAQFISQCLSDSGIANKWWYEEEEGHPVYMFNDDESMKKVINDLANGDYQKVVNNALEQWRRFSDSLMRMDQVILIDSTFLGYLTWTLFPMDVPVKEIEKYLVEVERIISPLKPSLIYFHQRDVHKSLKKICDKRGDTTTERFIQNASESKYGIARKLVGFDGMVSFWKDYRNFTNSIIEKTRMRKLSIENSEGNWDKYLLEIMEFLEISMSKGVVIPTEDMDSYTGIYKCGEMVCEVYRMNNELYMNGIQQIWPNSRLLPRMKNQFEVESLPIKVTFSSTKIHMEGPRLFDGSVEKVFSKRGRFHHMLGLPKGQVFIVPWNEDWMFEYEQESQRINTKLNKFNVTIYHIGSTSIRDLSAKPIIDIAVELDHFDDGLLCVSGLEELGYRYHGTNLLPERHYFNKGEPRTHQIHMYAKNNRYLKEQLLFRDYLNCNEESRQEYQELKERLSKINSTDKHAYADAKTEFIKNIILKAKRW